MLLSPGIALHVRMYSLWLSCFQINGMDDAQVCCYKQPYSKDPQIQSELPSPPQLPLYRKAAEVTQELLEKGLYMGTYNETDAS